MDTRRRTLVQTTYDDLSVEYAAHLAGELADKPGDRALLDRFAAQVRGAGVDIAGIDLSPGMVDQARGLHPGIAFRVGDMLALDVEDETLAGVVAFYAIVHLAPDDLSTALREVRRVLRPGGTALVAFHVGDEVVRPGELWGVPVALEWIFYRTGEVTQRMTSAGLTVVEALERDPYEGVEHPSRRAYVVAGRPA